ncbi:MAG: tRNA lysidine(34) synthetase TilS [Spirochaetales bacterium]|nr:tRNA lysidine(34) synthetase TilS [Candidatus Physcosoma equi]
MSIPSRLNIPGEGKLLVAFSGGSDSLYLLFVLSLLAKERTTALYVDHNLRSREELEKEIALNQHNASLLGIPLVIKTLSPGSVHHLAEMKDCGVEAAARSLRYEILLSYARENGYCAVLTAHHREDQVETVLMRMMDGSPFWTWSGIAERNDFIRRPILDVTKREILETLKETGLSYSEDSTDLDVSFKRNSIRHHVAPVLSEEVKERLCRIAENVGEFNETLHSIPFKRGFWCEFGTGEFLSSLPRSQEKLLFAVFASLKVKTRITRAFIKSVVEKAKEGSGRLEGYGLVFYFSSSVIKVYPRLEPFSVPYLGEETRLPNGLVVDLSLLDALTLEIPKEFLEGSVLRLARPGDRIELCSGMRRVSDFGKEHRHPQSLVIEQNGRVVATLNRVFGGRDRLFAPALGKKGEKISVILHNNLN